MKKSTILILLVCLAGLASAVVWLWPHDAEFYYRRGLERMAYVDQDGESWDLDGMLADYNHAIRLKPDFARVYADRGWVKAMMGDHGGAVADYNRAIELDPKDARNFFSRYCYWELWSGTSNHPAAIADLDRAIELTPKDWQLFDRRARSKSQRGNFSGMVADQERTSEVFPSAPSDRLRLAAAAAAGRDPARLLLRLLRTYNRAIESDPAFYQGYYHRGVLKYLANDPAGALADFRQCAGFPDARLKDYAAIHTWLVRAQQGATNEANRELSAYFNSRTNGTPRDWEAQIARFLLGQSSESDFSGAVGSTDAGWERSQFWFYAGMKQLLAGDKVKAVEDFRKARSTETRPYAVAISTQIELSRLGQ